MANGVRSLNGALLRLIIKLILNCLNTQLTNWVAVGLPMRRFAAAIGTAFWLLWSEIRSDAADWGMEAIWSSESQWIVMNRYCQYRTHEKILSKSFLMKPSFEGYFQWRFFLIKIFHWEESFRDKYEDKLLNSQRESKLNDKAEERVKSNDHKVESRKRRDIQSLV